MRYINLRLLTYLLTYVVIRIRKIFSEAVGSAPRNAHVTSFSISKLMEVTHCRRTLSCPAPVFRTSSFGPPPPDHFSLANPKCATAPPNTIANSGHWPKCTHTHTHTHTGQLSALCLLDLTAAFDTVDHDLLLLRLEHQFGLRGIVLRSLYLRQNVPRRVKKAVRRSWCVFRSTGLGARSATVHCIHGGPRSCSPEAQRNGSY